MPESNLPGLQPPAIGPQIISAWDALARDLAPAYDVSIDWRDRRHARYVATARRLGTRPWAVIAADPAELRSAVAASR
jgi:hypothetical protein